MSDNMPEYMSDRMSTKMFECHVKRWSERITSRMSAGEISEYSSYQKASIKNVQ